MKRLVDYLGENIGKACILNSSNAGKVAGEIIEVFEEGFVRLRTIDEELICNLRYYETVKVR